MSTATEDAQEREVRLDDDDLPWDPADWPPAYHQFLGDLPAVDQELSEILDQALALKELADAALRIYLNAAGMADQEDPEPGHLSHEKARTIAPMRRDVARAMWGLYNRLDDFYDQLQKYEHDAQKGALRLAWESGDDGDGSGPGLRDAVHALAVAESIVNRHVNQHALDVDGAVRYLEHQRHKLEDMLGIDSEGSDRIVANASDMSERLIQGEAGD